MLCSLLVSEAKFRWVCTMYIVLHIGIARMGRQGQDLNYYGQERMVKFFRSYLHNVPTFPHIRQTGFFAFF